MILIKHGIPLNPLVNHQFPYKKKQQKTLLGGTSHVRHSHITSGKRLHNELDNHHAMKMG